MGGCAAALPVRHDAEAGRANLSAEKKVKQIKPLGSNSSDEGAFWRENASVMPLINTPEVMTRDIDR